MAPGAQAPQQAGYFYLVNSKKRIPRTAGFQDTIFKPGEGRFSGASVLPESEHRYFHIFFGIGLDIFQ